MFMCVAIAERMAPMCRAITRVILTAEKKTITVIMGISIYKVYIAIRSTCFGYDYTTGGVASNAKGVAAVKTLDTSSPFP
ncbi:hypothetical protein NO2_0714 [Candidatus Termititenax persephonae]|uniref:Uncharacterized protein n=1 Tax=Candidatus Termititenax persephonae TaxID=2218525 RepID=A0A388TGA5_9BACT|nr:hypothetical protein NO2_0714 [Candidatus Termititenax persephonae]